jgi:methionyl aminopeptidase
MTTLELDKIVHDYIVGCGAYPSFLGLYGFPGSACISVNDEVIHGIPSAKRKLKAGDIVSVDVGAHYNGFHGDTAATFAVGEVNDEAKQLIAVTRESFFKGAEAAKIGNRIGDISAAVEGYIKQFGYSAVEEYVGHGVGRDLHEDPSIPNYVSRNRGWRIQSGMTFAIEPMINVGSKHVETLKNGWTVVTKDGKLSAHYEHTIAVTEDGIIILTEPDCGCL